MKVGSAAKVRGETFLSALKEGVLEVPLDPPLCPHLHHGAVVLTRPAFRLLLRVCAHAFRVLFDACARAFPLGASPTLRSGLRVVGVRVRVRLFSSVRLCALVGVLHHSAVVGVELRQRVSPVGRLLVREVLRVWSSLRFGLVSWWLWLWFWWRVGLWLWLRMGLWLWLRLCVRFIRVSVVEAVLVVSDGTHVSRRVLRFRSVALFPRVHVVRVETPVATVLRLRRDDKRRQRQHKRRPHLR